MKDVWNAAASGGGAASTAAVASVLAGKGSSFVDAFNGWAGMRLNNGFALPVLTPEPPTPFLTIPTGATTGPIPSYRLAVDHLAARYVALSPGDGTLTGPCYAATLEIDVQLPQLVGCG